MTGTEAEDPAVAWEAWLNEPIPSWTFTRPELIDALTHLKAEVSWPPPIQADGTIAINAESMADAIVAGLTHTSDGDQVTVSREDLRAALTANGTLPDAVYDRLAAAAGVTR